MANHNDTINRNLASSKGGFVLSDGSRINVTRSSMPSFDSYIDEIRDLWESRWLSNYGSKYTRLKDSLCDYLGIDNLVMFVNGHSALEAAIASFGLEGEVITTPFTFASTTHAIVRNGLTPVFCDIDEETYCIDASKIEDLITPRTSAIVPVHVYGSICDVEAIADIARRHELKVIYDAAHAFGVKKNGVGVARFGDASMFSFHATKVFHTIEGGAVAFSDSSLDRVLRRLQNFGYADSEDVEMVAGNAKMNEFQAAMGLCNLKRIHDAIASRGIAASRYRKRLSGVEGIQLPCVQEGVLPNYAYFPVVFKDCFGATRDQVHDALALKGIFSRKYFYPLTSEFPCYRGRFAIQDTPIAKRVSESVLALPLFEGLDVDDVDEICSIIMDAKKG